MMLDFVDDDLLMEFENVEERPITDFGLPAATSIRLAARYPTMGDVMSSPPSEMMNRGIARRHILILNHLLEEMGLPLRAVPPLAPRVTKEPVARERHHRHSRSATPLPVYMVILTVAVPSGAVLYSGPDRRVANDYARSVPGATLMCTSWAHPASRSPYNQ